MGWSNMKPWVKREILIVGIVLVAFIALMIVLLVVNRPEKVTCNTPYILVGTNCCLDNNSNKICDSDETPVDNGITGDFAKDVPEEEEVIEEIEAPTPNFEVHIRLKKSNIYEMVDGAELTYTGTSDMPDLTLSIKNLESETIRCDVNPYYAGSLVSSRVSRNVMVTNIEPKSIIMNGISSTLGEKYTAEEQVSCKFEGSSEVRTEKVHIDVVFQKPIQ